MVECPTRDCLTHYVVGDFISFTIRAMDQFGNPVLVGGEEFVVLMAGPDSVIPLIQDNNDGTYTATVCPELPGRYVIGVYLLEWLIGECEVTVEPGIPTNQSYVTLFSGKACSGDAYFTIQGVDQYGNPSNSGGVGFQATVEGPQNEQIAVSIQDNNDGTFIGTYFTTVSGYYTINVMLNGSPISGSPYTHYLPAGQKIVWIYLTFFRGIQPRKFLCSWRRP